MQDMYKKGYYIPVNYDVIKDVKPEEIEAPKQWNEYGSLLDISVFPPIVMQRDYGNDTGPNTCIIDYIWSEKWTIDETIEYMNRTAKDAVARYKESHTTLDDSKYIDKDWDILRKD